MSRILRFGAENFLRLNVVDITPDGDVVRITGKNGAGKTSVLNAIAAALLGGKQAERPIHKGKDRATIRLEIGDRETELIVTRRFSDKTNDLTVEAPSGARFPSPQRLLDGMLGAISFDPLAFTRMRPAEQYEALRALVKIEVDVDALAGQNQRDYETRTELNRDAARLRAQASGIAYPAETPAVPIDLDALNRQLRQATDENANRARRLAQNENLAALRDAGRKRATETREEIEPAIAAIREATSIRMRSIDDEIDRLKRRIGDLEHEKGETSANEATAIEAARRSRLERAAAYEQEAERIAGGIDDLIPENEEDTDEILARIERAQAINQAVEGRRRRETLEAEAKALEERSAALTAAIDARTEERRRAIAAAHMPVEGLGFGDNEVLFDTLPLSQASSGEQIRISAAIAMALHPKIRVLLVRDGSLLDEDSMTTLARMVKDHDYQLWIEQVATDGRVGIVLEDGSIAGSTTGDAPAAQGGLL